MVSQLDRLISEPRHIRGKLDGGWGPPPLTARPVVVTLLPTSAACPRLTQVTLGGRRAQRARRRPPRDAPRCLGPHPGAPGVPRPSGVHPGRLRVGPTDWPPD